MKLVLLALAAVALLALLFGVVFPWVDRNLLADPVMGAVGSAVAWVWPLPDITVP